MGMRIRLGYSPAPDGGVMFFGLVAGKVDTGELKIEPVAAGLPALNDRAFRGELEATMISAAAYPYLRQRYVLARCGACFARSRGPVLAAPEPVPEATLDKATIAVGDATGSAMLALQISRPGARTRLLPADKLAQATKMGLADCALLMHADTAAFRQAGLCCVADIAAGWAQRNSGLPLPLTCLAIRSDLAEDVRLRIEAVLRASIRFGLDHRTQAIRFAMDCVRKCAGGTFEADAGPLGVCVGEETVELDVPGRQALEEFLRRGHDADVVPNALPLEFVGGAA
ncbi:MAG: MqnA/MqnD/SBP family protein, partial [Phycisphaerae bacterium]